MVSNKTNEVVNSTQTSGGGRRTMVGFHVTSISGVGKVLHMLFSVVSCLFYYSFLS